jgi:hypothetical protein
MLSIDRVYVVSARVYIQQFIILYRVVLIDLFMSRTAETLLLSIPEITYSLSISVTA